MEFKKQHWRFLIGGMLLLSRAAFPLSLPKPQLSLHTLSMVVNHMLQYNPAVLQQLAQRYAAQANLQGAISGFMPQVFVSYSSGKEQGENPLNNEEDITLNRTDQTVGVTQPIFSGFSTYNLVKERKAQYQVALFTESAMRENVTRQTVLAYLEVLRFKHLYQLTLKNISSHKNILAKVSMKYHGGAGRKTELDLARGRLAQRRVSLRAIIGAQQQAVTNFKQLVGFYPVALVEPKPAAKFPETLASALQMAEQVNPNLLAAKGALQAANSAVAVSRGSLLPQVNLELSKSRTENAGGIRGVEHDSRAMVVVSYNLFRGGADKAAIDHAIAQREAAFQSYLDTKRAVAAGVRSAWIALQTDRKQLAQDRVYASAVRKVLHGYEEQFDLGRISLLNLLDMGNEVFSAEAAVINETYAVKYDSYRLIASMGSLVRYFTT